MCRAERLWGALQEDAEKAVTEQRQKQARAVKRVDTCRKELGRKRALQEESGGSSMPELAHFDNEIMFRRLQDANKTMLQACSVHISCQAICCYTLVTGQYALVMHIFLIGPHEGSSAAELQRLQWLQCSVRQPLVCLKYGGSELQEAAVLGAEYEETNIVTALAVEGIPLPAKSRESSRRGSRASSINGSSQQASLKSEASTRSGRLVSRAAPMQLLQFNL